MPVNWIDDAILNGVQGAGMNDFHHCRPITPRAFRSDFGHRQLEASDLAAGPCDPLSALGEYHAPTTLTLAGRLGPVTLSLCSPAPSPAR